MPPGWERWWGGAGGGGPPPLPPEGLAVLQHLPSALVTRVQGSLPPSLPWSPGRLSWRSVCTSTAFLRLARAHIQSILWPEWAPLGKCCPMVGRPPPPAPRQGLGVGPIPGVLEPPLPAHTHGALPHHSTLLYHTLLDDPHLGTAEQRPNKG